jgi:hypothetical protein
MPNPFSAIASEQADPALGQLRKIPAAKSALYLSIGWIPGRLKCARRANAGFTAFFQTARKFEAAGRWALAASGPLSAYADTIGFADDDLMSVAQGHDAGQGHVAAFQLAQVTQRALIAERNERDQRGVPGLVEMDICSLHIFLDVGAAFDRDGIAFRRERNGCCRGRDRGKTAGSESEFGKSEPHLFLHCP